MVNALKHEKQEQIRSLGRLGWSLRRIEDATGVRRETVSRYLPAAGISVRGRRQRRLSEDPNAASEVTTNDCHDKFGYGGGNFGGWAACCAGITNSVQRCLCYAGRANEVELTGLVEDMFTCLEDGVEAITEAEDAAGRDFTVGGLAMLGVALAPTTAGATIVAGSVIGGTTAYLVGNDVKDRGEAYDNTFGDENGCQAVLARKARELEARHLAAVGQCFSSWKRKK